MSKEEEFDWSGWLLDQSAAAEKEALVQAEREKEISRFRAWGKMGGRPRSDDPRDINFTVKLSGRERERIRRNAESFHLTMSEFMRKVSLGIQPVTPRTEDENRELECLLEYHTNFSRISNYIKDKSYPADLVEEIYRTNKLIKRYVYDRLGKDDKGKR